MESNRAVWKIISDEVSILLNYILKYQKMLKMHSKRDDRIGIIISIIYRIIRNIRAVLLLSAESAKKEDSIFMKLPVGILIRNCIMDGILAMHIANNNDQVCKNLMALSNRNYLNALFEEFEVYRDKLGDDFDEVTSEHMYTMAIEDTYLNELQWNEGNKKIEPLNERNIWKATNYRDIYEGCKKADIDLKNIMDFLCNDNKTRECVKNLYAYYKYFSQYEHFSQRGDGDSLADFGFDNIRFEKAIIHLQECIKFLIEIIVCDS
ncbi:MAG: hypothetical protein K2M31_04155 [Muribaculaceae bacterium]|nr:hypothetical protein [Muribaculaceae bacterium]